MLEAIIWDLDGVIVDSGPYHLQAWQQLARENGQEFSEEQFRRTFGMRSPEIIATVFGEGLPEEQVASLAKRKEELFRNAVRGHVSSLPGAVELIHSTDRAGFRLALASSAPYENVELILDSLQLKNHFDVIVTSEDVTAGKPDPQIFLIAAKRLGARPANCLVIEDAVPGVQAAKAAGMKCIAVAGGSPRPGLEECDLVVDSLEMVDLATITSLA